LEIAARKDAEPAYQQRAEQRSYVEIGASAEQTRITLARFLVMNYAH
jgi:hypothetical protein